MRWLWREDATGAVLEFLEDTPGMARAKVDEVESVGRVAEGEEAGPGPP